MQSANNDSSADADNEMTMYKKQEMSFVQGRGKRGRKRNAKKTEEALSAGEMDDDDENEGSDQNQNDTLTKHEDIHTSG